MKKIFYNGTLVTMDDSKTIANAIVIEDGKIIFVGSDTEALALKCVDDECVDLEGKTVLPAFMDAHSHFTGFANSLSQCDLSSATSFEDIVQMMKSFIQKRKIAKGKRVVGCNYDHNFLAEKKHPDKFVLDQISKEHEIVLVHASSHMGVVNQLALDRAGMNEYTKDVEGGRYGRVEHTLELDGYMEENAFLQFQNQSSDFDVQELFQNLKNAQDIYASYGITTIQEGMMNEGLFQLLQYASNQKLLYLDVVGYLDIQTAQSVLQKHPEYLDYQNHFRIGGYKVFLDGSPQGRTAWMLEPYENSEQCGYPVLSDEKLKEYIQVSVQDHQQLLAHCNGDAACEQYIRMWESIGKQEEYHRPVMIHAQLVQKKQLKRMVDLHMIPSFFVAHVYHWGDIHLENFGTERASRISPANSARILNLPFTFHQDTPVLPPNMLHTVWCAVKRKTRNGIVLGEEQRISVYDALKAVTRNVAYQYHEESQKGILAKGMEADLVILDRNPLLVDVDELLEIQVLETIKLGKTVYHK